MYTLNNNLEVSTLFVKSPICVKDSGEFQLVCHVWEVSFRLDLYDYDIERIESQLEDLDDKPETLDIKAKKEDLKVERDMLKAEREAIEKAFSEDGFTRLADTSKPDQLVKAVCISQKGHVTSFKTVPGAIVEYLDKLSGYMTLFGDKGGTWSDARKKRYNDLKKEFSETFSKVYGTSPYIKDSFKLNVPSYVLDELLVKLSVYKDKAIKCGACKVNDLTKDVITAKKFYREYNLAVFKALGMFRTVERKNIKERPTC